MDVRRIAAAIVLSAVCTFILRALPFLAFHGERHMPLWLEKLGKALPAAIMAVLLVYCVKDVGNDFPAVFLPKGAAVLLVGISYRWKHNTLLSIVLGTGCYMAFLRVFS